MKKTQLVFAILTIKDEIVVSVHLDLRSTLNLISALSKHSAFLQMELKTARITGFANKLATLHPVIVIRALLTTAKSSAADVPTPCLLIHLNVEWKGLGY